MFSLRLTIRESLSRRLYPCEGKAGEDNPVRYPLKWLFSAEVQDEGSPLVLVVAKVDGMAVATHDIPASQPSPSRATPLRVALAPALTV